MCKQKKKLILWSGGFDSTGILLQEFCDIRGKDFDLCYCILPNNDIIQHHEILARSKLLKKIESMFPDNRYQGNDYTFRYAGNIPSTDNYLPQPFVWGTTLAWNLDVTKYDEIVMGYIKRDDFWHIRTLFEQMVITGLRMLSGQQDFDLKFSYPYEWHTKQSILDAAYHHTEMRNLLTDVVICEDPGHCAGSCSSCKRHLSEFGYLVNGGSNYSMM